MVKQLENEFEYLYKGFVEITDTKKPKQYIKNETKFYSYEYARRRFNSYGGVLKDNIVMVDVDTQEESELLYKITQDLNLKCNVLKTTDGMHFYFENTGLTSNRIKKQAAIGINIDIKLGSKNTVDPLKINGEPRKWLNSTNNIPELPKWLTIVKNPVNFKKLQEGDGRNQALFNYILTLQSEGFNREEIRETIRIINKYILKDPLDDREIETILRDEAFQKPVFFKGTTLLHDKFAEYLKNEEHIIKINNILHIYNDGVYTANTTEIEKVMIKYIPGLTKSKRNEVIAYLDLIVEEKNLSSSDFIVLNNGLYNIKTDEITEFNINYIAKNKVPVNYNPAAYSEITDKTLNKIACNDKELRLLIEEMIGYTLLRRNELGKCFILTGTGSNGKSTILDVIKKFLGKDNISSVSLEELNQRFKTAELYGKLANIGDDISNKYIDDNAVFKKLVTGETVNVERKGKDPFEFNNYSKLIFSANEIPRINDTSNGLMRRLVIVPFNAQFSKHDKDFDPFIKDKLLSNESLEYLLKIAIQGLKRVLKNRGFTEVKSVEAELKEYERINNPVVAFLDENNIENQDTKDVYLQYSTWCVENKLKALSHIQFSREVCKHNYTSKVKKIDGKLIRIFEKVTDELQMVTDKN